MAIVVSTDGRRLALARLRPDLLACKIGLFANDFSPTPGSVLADFTEPTFDRYSRLPLNAWSVVYLNGEAQGETDAPLQKWLVGPLGGNDTVFGYFVVSDLGFVLFSERNPAGGQAMRAPGTPYLVIPRLVAGLLC